MASSEQLSTQQRRSINRVGRSVGVAVGLTVVLSFLVGINQSIDSRMSAVDSASETAAAAIEQGIRQTSLKLTTIDGLFSASGDVSPEEFATFVDHLDPHDEAEAVAVALRVSPEESDAFREALAVAHPETPLVNRTGLNPVEADSRRDHYIVAYQSVAPGFPSVLGFDVASEPNRYEALITARGLDATVVSPFVRRVTDLAADGFVIMTPVHDRSNNQIGVVMAGISTESVVANWVPASVRDQFDITITGIAGFDVPQSSWRLPSATAVANLPGRSWVIAAAPAETSNTVLWLAVVGALTSVGLAYGVGALITEMMSRRRLQRRLVLIQQLAQERQRTIAALADFELLARNSSDIIARQNVDLTYTYLSPAVESLLGYKSEEMVGQRPWEVFHVDDHQKVQDSIDALLAGGERTDLEHRVRHVDGRWLWFHTTTYAIRGPDGLVAELQTASRDVTERVAQRRALQEARDETERVANEKARFLATVSHEIRTPLSAVHGVSQLLADTQLDVHQREYVETIQSASASVVALVSDLLDLSKAEVGRLQIQSIDFDPRTTVGEVVRVLEAQADQKSVALAVQIDDDVPESITSDPYRLRQILVNLVGNALKFTDEGEIKIGISRQSTTAESVRLRFDVTDTGIGIPAHRLDAVFEEFEQVNAETPARYGGTGLGLGISRRLVQLMGGIIGVESELGVGSEFWFELPVAVGHAPSESSRRCLVVGRPANRAPFSAMLRAAGWTVTEGDTVPPSIKEPVFVRVATVDALEADETVHNAVVIDLLPRRGNSERVRALGAVGYLGAPTTGTELDAVLTQAATGEFTTRYVISGPSFPLRVLAADDAPSNRLLVERVLARRGHQVVSVADGAAALAALEEGEFDVVLLDGRMPIMGGIDVTREIRRRDVVTGVHTPVVLVSGRTSSEERAEAMEAGADLTVNKPFDVRKLQDVVERLGVRSGSGPDNDRRRSDEEQDSDLTGAHRRELAPVVDRVAFEVQVGGIIDFAGEIVDSVRSEWAELAPVLTREAITSDMAAAEAAAHRLKGVLSVVGAIRATELAARLEKACKDSDVESAMATTTALTETMTATEEALQAVLDEMEPVNR